MGNDSNRGFQLGAALGFGAVLFAVYWAKYRQVPSIEPVRTYVPAVRVESGAVSALPGLDDSDVPLRERLAALSPKAKLAGWLGIDGIIRRLVAATAIVSEGKSPKESLKFLKPDGPFAAGKKGKQYVLDMKGCARYDLLADALEAVDAESAAKLFTEYKPLFQLAYEELGGPKKDFQQTLIQAVVVLLQAPAVYGEIKLQPKLLAYTYEDPELEALAPAQKHLLRMGPRNSLKIQEKLRSFARALGTSDSQLPRAEALGAKPKLPSL